MFLCLYNYLNRLLLTKPCFARMKNFLTSSSQRVGSGGGGCVFARRSSRSQPGSFLSYQELITKRTKGRGTIHFVACEEARRPKKAGAGDAEAPGRHTRHDDAGRHCTAMGDTIGHKKGRPPYDGRPGVQRRGKAYWPRSTSTGFSSRSSRNLSGRSFWSGTVMSPWTYSR